MSKKIKVEEFSHLDFEVCKAFSEDCNSLDDGASLDDFHCDLDLFDSTTTTASTSPRGISPIIVYLTIYF